MNTATRLVSTLLLLAPGAAVAQAFEGTVVAVISAGGTNIESEQLVRGRMIRQNMSMSGNSVSIITDGASGKTIMINHPQKMWMDMAAMNQMMGRMGRGAPPAAEAPKEMPPIERTERVETIAGHECRHYVVTGPSGKVDLCAATGMGIVLPGGPPAMGGMGRGQGPAMPALPDAEVWMRAFRDGFFVLKMEATTPQGVMSWVVKSVERKSVPDDAFRPPPGYNEMKMPGGGDA